MKMRLRNWHHALRSRLFPLICWFSLSKEMNLQFVTDYIPDCKMSNVSVSKDSKAPNAEEYY